MPHLAAAAGAIASVRRPTYNPNRRDRGLANRALSLSSRRRISGVSAINSALRVISSAIA